jgi:hypothetical protein
MCSAATGTAGILSNMGMNSSKTWVLGGIAMVVSLGIAESSSLSEAGYLPKTGPTSLRFQIGRGSQPLDLPPLAMDDPDPSAVTAMPQKSLDPIPVEKYTAASLPPQTENYLPWMPWFYPLSGMSYPPPLPAPSIGAPTNTPPVSLPASDLLSITPQMLVEYFRPLQFGTNAAGASALGPVGFLPATPAPPVVSSNSFETP